MGGGSSVPSFNPIDYINQGIEKGKKAAEDVFIKGIKNEIVKPINNIINNITKDFRKITDKFDKIPKGIGNIFDGVMREINKITNKALKDLKKPFKGFDSMI